MRRLQSSSTRQRPIVEPRPTNSWKTAPPHATTRMGFYFCHPTATANVKMERRRAASSSRKISPTSATTLQQQPPMRTSFAQKTNFVGKRRPWACAHPRHCVQATLLSLSGKVQTAFAAVTRHARRVSTATMMSRVAQRKETAFLLADVKHRRLKSVAMSKATAPWPARANAEKRYVTLVHTATRLKTNVIKPNLSHHATTYTKILRRVCVVPPYVNRTKLVFIAKRKLTRA